MRKIEFNGKKQSLSAWAKELNIPYLTLYKRINDYGWSLEKALGKGLPDTKKKKVMILNDIHVPYQHENLLEEIEKNKDVDYILIGGDLVDCESCSSFPMLERPTLEQELIQAHIFINKIKEITKAEIICITGNHEARLEKDIMKMQQKGLQRMLDPQLLRMIQDGFNFYVNGKKVSYEPIEGFTYINKWYATLFDNMVIAHPRNFSNVPGRVAEQSAEYFLNKGIIDKEDIIFIGHTHKFSNIIASRRQNVFVVENGCSCKDMEYANNGNLSYGEQVRCYTILSFFEGQKIDKNDIKTYFY